MARSVAVLATVVALVSPCVAQQARHMHEAAAPGGAAVPLYDNLGSYTHPVTVKDPRAQRYFDQGLRLFYGFNQEDAVRSFREGARIDPSCAMCWWGVALAHGPNINMPTDPERSRAALAAVGHAQDAAAGVTPIEREYIAAMATRYSPDPAADRAALDRAYAEAMRDVVSRHPADLDAAVVWAEAMMNLRPWKLWTPDGQPAEGTLTIVETLESVLQRAPMHPGANHLYIHAVEASPHPDKALAAAERLKTLVPGAGHLVHMPAHVYMRVGDYVAAADANARAARVDEAYFRRSGHDTPMYKLMYYTHNLHFEAEAAAMAGLYDRAHRAADRAAKIAWDALPAITMGEYIVPVPWYVDLRFARWDRVLRLRKPPDTLPVALALWHYARGVALAEQRKVAAARTEQTALEAIAGGLDPAYPFGLQNGKNYLAVAQAVLAARVAAAAGDRVAAVAAWRDAVAAQGRLQYDEPPPWFYPVRESLGAEFYRAGDYVQAEAVFREDLAANPKNPRSLFGLAQALEAQHRTAAAAAVQAECASAWHGGRAFPLRMADL